MIDNDTLSDIVWDCMPEEEKQRIARMVTDAAISAQLYGTPYTGGTCCEDRQPVRYTPIEGIKPYDAP